MTGRQVLFIAVGDHRILGGLAKHSWGNLKLFTVRDTWI